ncbi:hypothetical protein MHM83_10885 [Tenacibaculum sp. Mcav3-52]|uniref:hypothetical protein n=1 Tax=Tenacibaculum sp. Mcav3-52 TaxID=2917762 RepID=UPI001EF346B5|nr:hypothetical protein [Tenacibaculum sp. Mcav3-52]MCG7502377.1 hypothetical protein [Tenacibaculum sp. Mcav3-52]
MKTKILLILFSLFTIGIVSAQRTTVPDDLQITRVELGTAMDSIGVLDSKKVLKYIPQTTLLDRAELQIQPKLDLKENLSNKVTDFSIVNHTKYPSVQAVQTELANFINNSQKAVPNGVASLDVSGKIPMAQIPDALVGSVSYQGNYDALANTPTLAESPATSTKGHYYVVTQSGTRFGETYSLGDWIISNGVEWQKVDNNNDVASVFGRKGVVVPLESDYENFYFKKAGGNITGNTVIDPLNSNTNIAGSNLTVKKESTSTSTNVAQFIDVDRQASSTPSNLSNTTYGLVSRVVNNSLVEDAGVTGSNLVGRNASSSNFNFAYGTKNTGEASGSGNGNFIVGTSNDSKITGAAAIDYLRGISSSTIIDNTGATANYMQGSHNSLVFTNGSVGQADVLYLDVDTGGATVTGDLAYLRAGNDALPTINGNSYFIKSESPYPSEFAGSIKSDIGFIGNWNGNTQKDFIIGETSVNQSESGSYYLLEDVNTSWGVDAVGFRRMLDGLSNTYKFQSASGTTVNDLYTVGRDSGDFNFYRGINLNTGIYTGNGTGITNVNAEKLGGVSASDFTNRNSSIESNLDTKYDIDFFGWNNVTTGLPAPGTYGQGLSFVSSTSIHNDSNNWITQLGFSTSQKAYFRTKVNSGPWGEWKELIHTDNISDYAGLPAGFYEEGTFTPTLVDQGGGATYSFTVNKSEYIRTGNNIMINIYLTNINTSGTPSGSLYISNLPELADSGSGGAVTIGNFYGSNLSSSNLDRIKSFFVSNNRVYFGPVQSNSTFSSVTFTSGTIRITANYKTNVYTP